MPQRGEQMNADERKQRVREVTVNVLGGMKVRAIRAYTEVHPEQSEVERAAVLRLPAGAPAAGGSAAPPQPHDGELIARGRSLRADGLHGAESRETHAEAPNLVEIEGQREPEHTAQAPDHPQSQRNSVRHALSETKAFLRHYAHARTSSDAY